MKKSGLFLVAGLLGLLLMLVAACGGDDDVKLPQLFLSDVENSHLPRSLGKRRFSEIFETHESRFSTVGWRIRSNPDGRSSRALRLRLLSLAL